MYNITFGKYLLYQIPKFILFRSKARTFQVLLKQYKDNFALRTILAFYEERNRLQNKLPNIAFTQSKTYNEINMDTSLSTDTLMGCSPILCGVSPSLAAQGKKKVLT